MIEVALTSGIPQATICSKYERFMLEFSANPWVEVPVLIRIPIEAIFAPFTHTPVG